MSGYLFEKSEGNPFKEFVTTISENKIKAKKEGNVAIDYVYKILMNFLYGRFGISPESTATELCNDDHLRVLIQTCDKFLFGEPLRKNINLASYHFNTNLTFGKWSYMKNAAVHLSTAITAYARIHLYPYISRDDCYYIDTNSIVLGHPLPCDVLFPLEIGKFKLEDEMVRGFFLSTKVYWYKPKGGTNSIIKFKGPAKRHATSEWFESQYTDLSRIQEVEVENLFRVIWSKTKVRVERITYKIGLKPETRRALVYNKHGAWVDTKPLNISIGDSATSCKDHQTRKKYPKYKIIFMRKISIY
ncbi:hypothetical protein T459_27559 [Capsicum annuum]|uniref:DNA-directed DNA polymerase n=1 Tax=Capsicum annuum TaxID=4072 RepID=A0A2G2YE97_CAPAN|nr:hypothetical protein T459_27559 [Capsicum annuum]